MAWRLTLRLFPRSLFVYSPGPTFLFIGVLIGSCSTADNNQQSSGVASSGSVLRNHSRSLGISWCQGLGLCSNFLSPVLVPGHKFGASSIVLVLHEPYFSLFRLSANQAAATESGPAQWWCKTAATREPSCPPATAGNDQAHLRRQSDLW